MKTRLSLSERRPSFKKTYDIKETNDQTGVFVVLVTIFTDNEELANICLNAIIEYKQKEGLNVTATEE